MKIKYCGQTNNNVGQVQITLENNKNNIHTKEEEGESLYHLGYGDADCLVRKVYFTGYNLLTPGIVKKEMIRQAEHRYRDASSGNSANANELNALNRVENLYFDFDFDSFEKTKIKEVIPSKEKSILASEYKENIKHPNHYQGLNGMEVIEVINNFELNFNTGNVIKYVLRAGKKEKNKKVEDLRKAIQYLEFEIDKLIK